MIELVPSTLWHIPVIAGRMREWDRRETEAMGHSPEKALALGLKASIDCMTALINGVPAAMLGLVPRSIIGGEGAPWMLGTDAIYANPRPTMVLSRRMIERWRDSLPTLRNLVAAGNDKAIRYLRRLGFEVGEERTVIRGVEFVTFSMERS
jgi:ribosomal protein S18 acetylase RimI-like enzyme